MGQHLSLASTGTYTAFLLPSGSGHLVLAYLGHKHGGDTPDSTSQGSQHRPLHHAAAGPRSPSSVPFLAAVLLCLDGSHRASHISGCSPHPRPSPTSSSSASTAPKQQSTKLLPHGGVPCPGEATAQCQPTSLTHTAAFVPNCLNLPFPWTPSICSSKATALKLDSPAEPFTTSGPGAPLNRAEREEPPRVLASHILLLGIFPSPPKHLWHLQHTHSVPHLPQGTVSLPGTEQHSQWM